MNKTATKVFLCLYSFSLALFILIALLFAVFYGSAVLKSQAEVKLVTIPEGLTAVEVSEILKREGIFVNGEILPQELDGYLFPDTYEFYSPASLGFVVKKISDNFTKKVIPNIPELHRLREILTVASMVEEETNNSTDRRLVAGIIWKRLASNMFLQVDATICYVKPRPCFPVTKADLSIDSPYNTYLYKGLPEGPVSNPGLDSILASLNPSASKYWYYLADPKSGRTIFANTLEEHNKNISKYLK